MTPDPTLTDEELAEMKRWSTHHLTPVERRLIAEVDRLRSEAREEYARAEQAESALVAAKAEIQKLRRERGSEADALYMEAYE